MKKKSLLIMLASLFSILQGAWAENTPQAIWCAGNTTLYFINSESEYTDGDTYDNQTVTQVWSGDDVTATPTNGYPAFNDAVYDACTRVVFDKSFASVRPTSCYGWFTWFHDLMAIEGLAYLNTTEVTTTREMFCYGLSLTSLDLSSFNTAKVTDMDYMFSGCSSLKTIYVSDSWTTDNVTSSDDMFYGCENLVGGQGTEYDIDHRDKDYAHIDGGEDNPGYLTPNTMIPTPQAIWCAGNTTLYFINSATVYATDDTYDNQTVTQVWSGDKVTATPTEGFPEFKNAVSGACTRVVFDKSFASVRPTSCWGWFENFRNLAAIEGLAYLNTSLVTTMNGMFTNCSSLTSLDLSGFNTANVTEMSHMFESCSSLASLDLSGFNFNTANVTNMEYMFFVCSSLKTIYVSSSWTTDNVKSSDDMFGDCTSLVGGQGTTYNDSNPKDMTYAHIDGGEDNPGYLTLSITLADNDTKKPVWEKNSNVIDAYCGQTTNVTLAGRTLYKDGEWNTICLPFNVTLEGSPLEGAIAKTLTGATMTGTHVTLTFGNPDSETEPVTTLKAGVPYIIKWEADTEQPTITNPTFRNVTLADDDYPWPIRKAGDHVWFCGYYNAFNITPDYTNYYYMTAGSTLKHTGIDRTLNACRAYFRFTEAAAARQIVLDFGSDRTQGITSVGTQAANSHWFTVNGVRVENPVRKGLYIRNGKKTVVK